MSHTKNEKQKEQVETLPPPEEKEPEPPALNMGYVHMYRAEVGRSVEWRHRLDVTTNWAVITTGAAITFALGSTESERHVVILLVSILVTFFLLIEARRFRLYDVWQQRVHLLESEFYAPLLNPEIAPDPTWKSRLAQDLREPKYHISMLDAVGWRLRRNYLWLYLSHLLIWFIKVAIHPVPIRTFDQFLLRATVGPIPGWAMIFIGTIFNVTLVVIALVATRRLRASGEIMRC